MELIKKVEIAEAELLKEIEKGGFNMQTAKLVEMYNQLCKFKKNLQNKPMNPVY